ncbi:MAG TPA: hypothetical protein PKA10_16310 [Selenomonadales bacterium]|nr:hypothetical protein [Selenomonadales bacterium]
MSPKGAPGKYGLAVLADMVQKYYEVDTSYKELEAEREYLNKSIKQLMSEHALEKYRADDLLAVLRTQTRRTLNKESAVARLKELGLTEAELDGLFETKEIALLSVSKA